jgi:hypothetical protein
MNKANDLMRYPKHTTSKPAETRRSDDSHLPEVVQVDSLDREEHLELSPAFGQGNQVWRARRRQLVHGDVVVVFVVFVVVNARVSGWV